MDFKDLLCGALFLFVLSLMAELFANVSGNGESRPAMARKEEKNVIVSAQPPNTTVALPGGPISTRPAKEGEETVLAPELDFGSAVGLCALNAPKDVCPDN